MEKKFNQGGTLKEVVDCNERLLEIYGTNQTPPTNYIA